MQQHHGAVYDPETVELLKGCLEEAWSHLDNDQQSRLSKTLFAERILKAAAKGERDPVRLKTAALVEVVPSV